MQNSFLSSFTPSLMSSQDLEAIFVQRENLVEDLIAGVRESATTKNKHYRLLIGMRGIGKTHTIALLYHRLKEIADLKDKLLIAWLKEEEWGVSSWLDLQIRIFQALANSYPQEYRNELAADVEALYQLSPEEATARGEIILKEFTGKRTLLILTENFDEILKGLGDIGQKKFRVYLQNKSFITIVATAQNLSNDLKSKKKAFYGFFNTNNLDKLSLDEATNLLTKIAQLQKDAELTKFVRSQTGRDRIKAIHHLAGGNHRVYTIFSQFLTRDSLDDLVQPVMQTLDELTPYYQARMQWLSPQQRKIVELLCDRRHALPVKEIAQRCFISHQTASSQLKDLLNKGYVVKETQGRESFYELQEPLMRICLETKKQRGKPIKLFIDFLCIWYTTQELKTRYKTLPDTCLEKKYILKALDIKTHLVNDRLEITTVDYLEKIWSTGMDFEELGEHSMALDYFDELLQFQPDNSWVWYCRGVSLGGLKKYQESSICYKKALEIDSNNCSALQNLAFTLCMLDLDDESMKLHEKLLEKSSNIQNILNNIAGLLFKSNNYDKALNYLDRALDIESDNETALYNRCIVLDAMGRYEDALYACNQYLAIYSDNEFIWNNRGCILYELGQYNDALDSYNEAISINQVNFDATFNRSEVLLKLNYWDEGFSSLESSFSILEKIKKSNTEYTEENTKEIIRIIFDAKQKQINWKDKLKALVKLHDRYQEISSLDKGITENIPNILSEMVSNKAARTWLEVWQEVAGDQAELEIALRFLKTAVEYKETKGDSRVLLQLPKEERDLFVTLLE